MKKLRKNVKNIQNINIKQNLRLVKFRFFFLPTAQKPISPGTRNKELIWNSLSIWMIGSYARLSVGLVCHLTKKKVENNWKVQFLMVQFSFSIRTLFKQCLPLLREFFFSQSRGGQGDLSYPKHFRLKETLCTFDVIPYLNEILVFALK